MSLGQLKDDIAMSQKKGLPFIITSVIIWGLITVITALDLPWNTRNMLVFCSACPLMPISWLIGRSMKVDIFSNENPLSKLGLLFTMNQMLYILIAMWVYRAVPEKMVMVYAMIFGAHLLPYSWLYTSNAYRIFAIAIPFIALFTGIRCSALAVSAVMMVTEIIFVLVLAREYKAHREILRQYSE
ncbi:MAG: hypothetical protein IJM15_07460 [Erysipelotrichaceae bacterium]|nr:hypothetical protein [Erysipelotrichaceae bacterium]